MTPSSSRSALGHRVARVLLVGLAVCTLVAAGCGSDATPSSTVSIGAGLTGPPGVRATLYARGVPHVAALAFDPQGRLWAASAAYDDTGHDAVFVVARSGSRPVEVISGLHIVLGLLWYRDELYVSSHARVDAYRGFNGTRFTARRTVVSFPADVGEGNGIALGPDGRISLGITNPTDHSPSTLADSAAVVSFRPDGQDLRVDVRNVRAPVGLTYFPGTSDLFVTMNQRDDLGTATPGDWLSVVHEGQNWKFPGCWGQGGAACTGVPRPTAVLDPHAAVSGVAIVTGQLGPGVGTAALVAEWADHEVLRVALRRHGSTYTGSVSPFLHGLENPVPVEAGPGGSVFVGDWGNGRIYRIARA